MNFAFKDISKIRKIANMTGIDSLSSINNLSGLLPEGDLREVFKLASEKGILEASGLSQLMQMGGLDPEKLENDIQKSATKYAKKLEAKIDKDKILTEIDNAGKEMTQKISEEAERVIVQEGNKAIKEVEDEIKKETDIDISLDFLGDYEGKFNIDYDQLKNQIIENIKENRNIVDIEAVKAAAIAQVTSEAKKIVENNGIVDKAKGIVGKYMSENKIFGEIEAEARKYIPDEIEPHISNMLSGKIENPIESIVNGGTDDYGVSSLIKEKLDSILNTSGHGDAFTEAKKIIDEFESLRNGETQ